MSEPQAPKPTPSKIVRFRDETAPWIKYLLSLVSLITIVGVVLIWIEKNLETINRVAVQVLSLIHIGLGILVLVVHAIARRTRPTASLPDFHLTFMLFGMSLIMTGVAHALDISPILGLIASCFWVYITCFSIEEYLDASSIHMCVTGLYDIQQFEELENAVGIIRSEKTLALREDLKRQFKDRAARLEAKRKPKRPAVVDPPQLNGPLTEQS